MEEPYVRAFLKRAIQYLGERQTKMLHDAKFSGPCLSTSYLGCSFVIAEEEAFLILMLTSDNCHNIIKR